MRTVLQIIEEAGGLTKAECISIENEPWMRLVIEVLPERGPDGRTVVSATLRRTEFGRNARPGNVGRRGRGQTGGALAVLLPE